MVGMRSPALDLAWQMPGFRLRMAKRVPIDEWLFPNINTGCVIKFNERGEVLESLWDLNGVNHPMITSMREHRGYLYLGGIANNRIGRYKLDGADPDFVQYDRRWGRQHVIAALQEFADRFLGRGDGDHHGAVVRRRVETQPDAGEGRDVRGVRRARGSGDRRDVALHRRRSCRPALDGDLATTAWRVRWTDHRACLLPDGGLAVALDGREVRVVGGGSRRQAGRALPASR